MNMRPLLLAVVLTPFVFCMADDTGRADTQAILERTVATGIEILKDKTLGDADKMKKFDAVFSDVCHLDLMSYLSLGPTVWKSLSAAERQEFTSSFTNLIKRSYYGKLAQQDANGFAADYISNEANEGNPKKRILKAVMKTKTNAIKVDYSFALLKDKWGIYDVEVEGISLVASYKAQFQDYLARHSIQELMAEIKGDDSEFLPAPDGSPPASPEK